MHIKEITMLSSKDKNVTYKNVLTILGYIIKFNNTKYQTSNLLNPNMNNYIPPENISDL